MSIWDDPEMKVNDDFVKFETVGESVTGTILTIRAHRFDNNSVAPQILLELDDGTEKTVTAGQIRLKAKLAELRPEAGDRIRITLTQVEKRAGGKELKHFEVDVWPAGTLHAAPAAAPAPAAYTTQPQQPQQAYVPPAPDPAPAPQPAAAPPAPAPAPPPAPAAAPPAPAPAAPDPNALAAAVASLTDEQRRALGLG